MKIEHPEEVVPYVNAAGMFLGGFWIMFIYAHGGSDRGAITSLWFLSFALAQVRSLIRRAAEPRK